MTKRAAKSEVTPLQTVTVEVSPGVDMDCVWVPYANMDDPSYARQVAESRGLSVRNEVEALFPRTWLRQQRNDGWRFRHLDETLQEQTVETIRGLPVLDCAPHIVICRGSEDLSDLRRRVRDLFEEKISEEDGDDTLPLDYDNVFLLNLCAHLPKGRQTPSWLKELPSNGILNMSRGLDSVSKSFYHFGNYEQLREGLFGYTEEESSRLWAENLSTALKNEVERLKEELDSLSRKIRNKSITLGLKRSLYKSASSFLTRTFAQAKENLEKDSRVERVWLDGYSWCLRTKDIFVSYTAKEKYFVGAFEFKVQASTGISIRNYRMPVSSAGRLHPHGYTDSVCLGTFDGPISSALSRWDIATLGFVLLEWVSELNDGDSRAVGSLGSRFPLVRGGKVPSKIKTACSDWADFIQNWQQHAEDVDEETEHGSSDNDSDDD